MSQLVVKSLVTGNEIPYSFKVLTYRQFQKAITSVNEQIPGETSAQKRARQEEVANALLTVEDVFFEEASNKDVQRAIKAAIDFNTLSDEELKKSV